MSLWQQLELLLLVYVQMWSRVSDIGLVLPPPSSFLSGTWDGAKWMTGGNGVHCLFFSAEMTGCVHRGWFFVVAKDATSWNVFEFLYLVCACEIYACVVFITLCGITVKTLMRGTGTLTNNIKWSFNSYQMITSLSLQDALVSICQVSAV